MVDDLTSGQQFQAEEETVERAPDAKVEGGAKDAAALWSQALIDQLFQEVKGETFTSPGSSANGTGGDQR